MSSVLALAQTMEGAGVGGFTDEEHTRARAFKIPGEEDMSKRDPRFYPRRPVEDPKQWFANWQEKLYGLERAAGLR